MGKINPLQCELPLPSLITQKFKIYRIHTFVIATASEKYEQI